MKSIDREFDPRPGQELLLALFTFSFQYIIIVVIDIKALASILRSTTRNLTRLKSRRAHSPGRTRKIELCRYECVSLPISPAGGEPERGQAAARRTCSGSVAFGQSCYKS